MKEKLTLRAKVFQIFKGLSLTIVLTVLSMLFQYYISRPIIIIDKIEESAQNPFNHSFAIKNVGITKAYKLKINLINPYIVIINGPMYMPAPGDKPRFGDSTKISQIDLSPQQYYDFSPSEFISFNDRSKGILKIPEPFTRISEASIKLIFYYRDFFRIIQYEEEFTLTTESKNNQLKWKIVSNKYYDKYKKDRW